MNFKVGDCGFTRSGKPYKVISVNEIGLLSVEIDGTTKPAHCYSNGKCYADERIFSEDLLPPDASKPMTFKPGDRVRVLRTATSCENGWKNVWVRSMNDAIGLEFEVEHVSKHNVYFTTRPEGFPPFILELVTAETATTTTNQATSEEKPVLKIEDRIYINGNNASDYSDDMLIKQISDAEYEAAKLKNIATPSEKIKRRIQELEDGAKRLAEILDARS